MPAGPFGVDEYQHAGYAEGLQDAERKRADRDCDGWGSTAFCRYCKQYGADGYAADAVSAVKEANRLRNVET